MKIFQIHSKITAGDITIIYYLHNGVMSFCIIPSQMEDEIAVHRKNLDDTFCCQQHKFDLPAVLPESMLQFKVATDANAAQHTSDACMRNSQSVDKLKFVDQEITASSIITNFTYKDKLSLRHIVRYWKNRPYILTNTEVENISETRIKLESLASFSLGMLSPFQADSGTGKYKIHRYGSNWSAEGRHEARTVEELNLEMSWQAAGMRALRFGNRGSMPVKEFFPFVGFEDTEKKVLWGVQLLALGPWQLEVTRFCDFLNIDGGMLEREFGQWTKTLAPGEKYATMGAVLSCVQGDIQDLMPRLTAYQEDDLPPAPENEKGLPALFNDWCTFWGSGAEKDLLPIAERNRNLGLKYFVLDAGWFTPGADACGGIGDWDVSKDKFPSGMKSFTGKIRDMGYVPGVWFEFENCSKSSKISSRTDLLLQLDGAVIFHGATNFLDFRNPDVWGYLSEKLIAMLRENNFGYMKVDYNSSTGFGCDGQDSPPEEIRKHLEAVEKFFIKLRKELPQLVIEICSSGGHRLSPAWTRLSSMSSFSDVHEGREAPIIAANVQQLIPLSHSQVWATLRKTNDSRRLHYSLASGMIGRLCLSGDMADLSEAQHRIVAEAVKFYEGLKPLVRQGKTRVDSLIGPAYSDPTGHQIVRRSNANGSFLIIHTFRDSPSRLSIQAHGEKIKAVFKETEVTVELKSGLIEIGNLSPFAGVAILLEK